MNKKEELVSEGLVSTKLAAEFLGVSRTTLWQLMNRQELPWVHIGRARYIPKRALIQLAVDNLKWSESRFPLK